MRERMPRKDEIGPNGRVIVWHRYNGAMISTTFQLRENQFMSHWMPYPDAPEGMEGALLKEITGPNDGSP